MAITIDGNGITTDTQDIDGEIQEQKDASAVTRAQVEAAETALRQSPLDGPDAIGGIAEIARDDAPAHERLLAGMARGDFRPDLTEAHAWAMMGMNVFLGLRYVVWSEESAADDLAALANDFLRRGIGTAPSGD